MANLTQERIEEQIAELTKNLNIIKILRELGDTKNDEGKFINNIPTISSGYSMGEYVQVAFVNKDTSCGIFSYGNYSTYAKSCKWKPTYGRVNIFFKTKKVLNDFVKACNTQDIEKIKRLILANLSGDSKICNNDLRKIKVYF